MNTCSAWFDVLMSDISNLPVDQNSPSPALLISFGKVPEKWYWEAVRGQVRLEHREEEVAASGITVLSHPNKWGMPQHTLRPSRPSIQIYPYHKWQSFYLSRNQLIAIK